MIQKFCALIALLLLGLFGNSCKSGQVFKISPNEDKGIKDVLHIIGGQCEYGISFSTSTKVFWLNVSQSEFVDGQSQAPALPASGIAYLFFRNLGTEQTKYTGIRSILTDDAGTERQFDFTIDTLKIVDRYFPLLQAAAKNIGNGDFSGLGNQLSRKLPQDKRELLLRNLNVIQADYGALKEVCPTGFTFYEADGKPRLHLAALLVREKKTHPFSVDVDPTVKPDSLLMLNYQF